MLALPHHAAAFTESHMLDAKHFDLVYQCIKGNMTPVVGSSWIYDEPLLSLGFEHNIPGVSDILSDSTIRIIMAENLEEDLRIALPTRDENIYGFGKQVARIAQLAHISNELIATSGRPANNSSHSTHGSRRLRSVDDKIQILHAKAVDLLSSNLELLLTNQLSDSLLYDATLGGLVSTDGLSDWNADFGNGRYNGM
jgi:endoglucanase Acf2